MIGSKSDGIFPTYRSCSLNATQEIAVPVNSLEVSRKCNRGSKRAYRQIENVPPNGFTLVYADLSGF